jgi:hypothetical protein
MRQTISTILLSLLTAYAVTPNPEAIGPYPADYRQIVKKHLQRTLFDPYSVRSASIAAPEQGHLYFRQGWLVCVELNAKNRMGGYVGLQRTAYLINRGGISHTMDTAPVCNAADLVYAPWPEIEQSR